MRKLPPAPMSARFLGAGRSLSSAFPTPSPFGGVSGLVQIMSLLLLKPSRSLPVASAQSQLHHGCKALAPGAATAPPLLQPGPLLTLSLVARTDDINGGAGGAGGEVPNRRPAPRGSVEAAWPSLLGLKSRSNPSLDRKHLMCEYGKSLGGYICPPESPIRCAP